METKYYKVVDGSGAITCATKFDEKVDFAKRIELRELLRMNKYNMIEVTEDEYNKIPKKIDAI